MNKRGQTLILFVILIPILLGMAALVVDVGLIVSKNAGLREVSKTIIESVYDDAREEEIKDLFIENDLPVESLEVTITSGGIRIQNEYEVDSIFGSIIGIKSYDIKVDITGKMIDDKIVFE